MQGELVCNGEVATAINAAFGKPVNNPALLVADSRPEHLKAPDDCQVFPFIEGLTPAFTQHFDARFEYGQPPMSGGDQADFGMWLRFKEPTEMKIPALIALADMPPMPGLNMVKPPCLGSSLSWYLEFPALTTDIAPDGWWYYDYRSQAGSGGYFNNYGTIWAPNGQAAMFTRQVAMVFQK